MLPSLFGLSRYQSRYRKPAPRKRGWFIKLNSDRIQALAAVASAFAAAVGIFFGVRAMQYAEDGIEAARQSNKTAYGAFVLANSPFLVIRVDDARGRVSFDNVGTSVAIPYYIFFGPPGTDQLPKESEPTDAVETHLRDWLRFTTAHSSQPLAKLFGRIDEHYAIVDPYGPVSDDDTNDVFKITYDKMSVALGGSEIKGMTNTAELQAAIQRVMSQFQIAVCYTNVTGTAVGLVQSRRPDVQKSQCPKPPAYLTMD